MASPVTMTPLRIAGKTERRCIMRQVLGYYHSLIVSALYALQQPETSEVNVEALLPALKYCIGVHPILSASLSDEATEAPKFVRPATLDLRNHVRIVNPADFRGNGKDEIELLKQVTVEDHDRPFPYQENIPPWKIIVLPVSEQPERQERRFYILFSFSHSHGDGSSGLAFHKTFLQGLNTSKSGDINPICATPSLPLLPPLEEGVKLSISWSYLLGPLLAVYLPKFISKLLNLQASVTPESPNLWHAQPYSYNAETYRTGLEIVVIDNETLKDVLSACKANGTKLTGLLHQLVVRALSEVVPADAPAGSFVAQTPLNLRRIMPGFTNDDMAVCTSADYELFPRYQNRGQSGSVEAAGSGPVVDEEMWAAARNTTARLAACANTATDQPVGLLQYLGHFRMWLVNQLGKQRDTSYELTNILVFDPLDGAEASSPGPSAGNWELGRTMISQPANALGSPISFNVATRKGSDMVITLTWQTGVLDLENESNSVKTVGIKIKSFLDRLAVEHRHREL
ncbi:hypothetical protein AOQ84DRAFT_362362 [Glonium stellatum]|uniref:Alcohol acetyltransferase n=1 Tax=Glonium stellatum TaxID=574774 RepID=A0A8E2F4N9_9PEZI|nr:hypothetical protein AOQ84DRAFT_362362 [Glonium stellatum]